MQYQELLSIVATQMHADILDGQFIESSEGLAREMSNTVLRWDVNEITRLRNLFPEYFPPALQSGVLSVWRTADGEWQVMKAKAVKVRRKAS